MFWWMAQNTLLAGALALAAALACRFGRFSPALRHALWLVVLLKLITPPLPLYSLPLGAVEVDWLLPAHPAEQRPIADVPAHALPAAPLEVFVEDGAAAAVELWPEEATTSPDVGQDETLLREFTIVDDDALRVEPQSIVDAARPLVEGFGVEGDASPSEPARLDVRPWLLGLWSAGCAFMVLLQAARLVRFRRLLRRTEPPPQELMALVGEIAGRLQVAAPHVALTSAVCSPMVCALGRPRLIWPKSLWAPMADDARRSVIIHELAHLRRRDHWVGWLELAASCVWWWNPLFWHVRRQLRENAELACDAWVVSLLPGGRRAYAQTLIEVSELLSWTAAPLPAVGMGASARRMFERRLTMILRERVPCRAPLVGLASIALLGMAVLPGWSQEQAPAAAAPKVEPAPLDDPFAPPDVPNPSVQQTEQRPVEASPPPVDEEFERPQRRLVSPTPTQDPFTDPLTQDLPGKTSEPPEPCEHPEREAGKRAITIWRPVPNTFIERKQSEIEKLEARLSELAAEVRALRREQNGATAQLAKPRPQVTATPPKVVYPHPAARVDSSGIVIDLKDAQGRREFTLDLALDQHVKVRLPAKVTADRIVIDEPEVVRIIGQSPTELELLAVRPGTANITLSWDDKEKKVFSKICGFHANVVNARMTAVPRIRHAVVATHGTSAFPRSVGVTEQGEAVETLTRARYRLPQTKADALAAFLKEHAGGEVEARLDGETLIVTASPDAQARIGQFIKLLLPKGVPARPLASGDVAYPVRTRVKTTSQVPALAAKVVRTDKLEPGEDAEFNIEVTNTGTIDATELQIVDHGGSGIEFTSATAGYSWAGDALSWRVDRLAPGKTIRFTVRCKLLQQQGDARHRVTVTSSEGANVKATALTDSPGDEPPVSQGRRLFDPPVAAPQSPKAAAPEAGTPKTP